MTEEPVNPIVQEPSVTLIYSVVQVGDIWGVEEKIVDHLGNETVKSIAKTGSKGEAERIVRVMEDKS